MRTPTPRGPLSAAVLTALADPVPFAVDDRVVEDVTARADAAGDPADVWGVGDGHAEPGEVQAVLTTG